ncbi:MAG: formylglycine-generating enzyme family protein [Planctomycetota bacterium]|nr:formylglycine-generating enzyme family protein [Planctomycetota bacterium]
MAEGEAALAARNLRAAEQAFTVALSLPGYGNDARARDGLAKATGKLALDCGGGVTLDLVRIPAGRFMMGSPSSKADRSSDEVQHAVTLSRAFYMGIYEVTQAQWWAVMGNNPSRFKGDDNPVENVSWYDAMEFCRKLSSKSGKKVRLPTEAEWEYACRAGTATAFSTGETIRMDQANYNGNADFMKGIEQGKTMRVGSFRANAWGLHDMHGNVFEWCSDWYGDYDLAKAIDPQGVSSGSRRVVRGGSWFNIPWFCRSANRFRIEPGGRLGDIGFRVVLD